MNREMKWLNDIPFPYRKTVGREMLMYILIFSILPLFIFFEIRSGELLFMPFQDLGLFVFFLLYIVLMGTLFFFFSLPILFEYLDYKFYEEIEDEVLFSNIAEMDTLGLQDDPVGKILKNRSLKRYVFKGRSQIYTGIWGNKKYRFIRIICTPTRKTYFKLLFFPREGEKGNDRKVKESDYLHIEAFSPYDKGRSRTAYPLKVTYTKYNHYLIRIGLIEGIDYPENFTTLVKRANEFV